VSGRRRRTTLVAVTAVAWLVPLGLAAPAAAAEQACDVAAVPDSEPLAPDDTQSNPVHERLGIGDAHELATGSGTRVAVIDSGARAVGGVQREPLFLLPGSSPELLSGHGTIVAGLIAGDDGVAPDSSIVDVKVFDAEGIDSSEGEPVTSAGIAAGVRAVVDAFADQPVDVVNISLAVPGDDPVLRKAVAELVALDTVVVAAAGNRVETGEGSEGTAGSDEEVYPADYPGVLAVSAIPPGGEDPAAHVAPNRDTDVAAPTVGAVSVNATDSRCVVPDVATSWAAAEVSGIVALLRQRFPDETARQIVARLEATTEGAGVQAPEGKADNPWTGAGVVQAHDALTRRIEPGRKGDVVVSAEAVGADAQAPPPPANVDLFGSSRALLLWAGLVAGALLALAFMLRPLIRR